jgi:hypothetical protein
MLGEIIDTPERRQPMDEKIIATYCLCDDLLKAMHHQDDSQCQMNDAEVVTTAFIAALFFRGLCRAIVRLIHLGSRRGMISPSTT